MAKAVEARGVRDLEYGDDLLGQLQFLNGKALSILDDAEASGEPPCRTGCHSGGPQHHRTGLEKPEKLSATRAAALLREVDAEMPIGEQGKVHVVQP